jgi:hypothetical protein
LFLLQNISNMGLFRRNKNNNKPVIRQILQRVAEGNLAAQRVVWDQQTRESKTQKFAIYVPL